MIKPSSQAEFLNSTNRTTKTQDVNEKTYNTRGSRAVSPRDLAGWKMAVEKVEEKGVTDTELTLMEEKLLDIELLKQLGGESELDNNAEQKLCTLLDVISGPPHDLGKERENSFGSESKQQPIPDELTLGNIPAWQNNMASSHFSLITAESKTSSVALPTLASTDSGVEGGAVLAGLKRVLGDESPEIAIKFYSDGLKGSEMQLSKQAGNWQLVALCSSGAAAESMKNNSSTLVQRFATKQWGKLDVDVLLKIGVKRSELPPDASKSNERGL